MKIVLQDFADESKLQSFDLGGTLLPAGKCEKACGNPSGFFSLEKVGLLNRRKALIAVFSDQTEIRLYISGSFFSLSDTSTIASLKRRWFGASRFTLSENGDSVLQFDYWSGRTDPSGMGGEIFEYAERITKNAKSRAEFLQILNALRAGNLNREWQRGNASREDCGK